MNVSNITPGSRVAYATLYSNPISHLFYACVQTFFGLYASANTNLARLTQNNFVAKHGVVFVGGSVLLVALVLANLWKKDRAIQNREEALEKQDLEKQAKWKEQEASIKEGMEVLMRLHKQLHEQFPEQLLKQGGVIPPQPPGSPLSSLKIHDMTWSPATYASL